MRKILLISLLSVCLGNTAWSADTPKDSKTKPKMMMDKEWTKEQRDSMAGMHEKMATCLRSDKSMKDCHAEMRTNCQDMMGKEGCPMMDDMMMGKKSRRSMMKESKEESKGGY